MMPRVAEPMKGPGPDGGAAGHRGDGHDTNRESAGLGRRGVGGWVLLGLASIVYAAASFMLAGLATGLLPFAGESPVPAYLQLLLAVAAAGLATAFTAGLRGRLAALPMLIAAVLVFAVYAATGEAVDPFLAAVAAGSLGALLGVVVADRRPHPARTHRTPAPASSRSRGLAWTIAALAVPVLAVLAMYLNSTTDLVWFEVAAGAVGVPAALGTEVCIAQARRHYGREPRRGLSMFLGGVAAVIALCASYVLIGTVYAQF